MRMTRWLGLVGALALAPALLAQTSDSPPSPARQYRTLERRYREAFEAFQKAYQKARTPEEKQKAIRDKHPDTARYAARFLALARKAPRSPAAVDALVWIVSHPTGQAPRPGKDDPRSQALRLLRTEHVRSDRLGTVCTQLAYALDPDSEAFLRAVLDRNPDEGVRARACASLAQNLRYRSRMVRRLKTDPESRKESEALWGKEVVRRLLGRGPDQMLREAVTLFERLAERHGEVKHPVHGTLGQLARVSLAGLRRPVTVGKPGPEISGTDLDGKPLKLSAQRGKVVLLDFWGHDFAPCRAAYPVERGLLERLAGKPFVILGVNCDPDRKATREAAGRAGITWRSWWDGGGTGGPIATRWDVEFWPTLFLIDHKGVVRQVYLGWPRGKELGEAIDDLVREAS
jgi:thiol-disulfide isomerase/thioredoxin